MNTSTNAVRRHRLTVTEYFRMGEHGILAPDARVELINGEIIDMTHHIGRIFRTAARSLSTQAAC